MIQGSVVAVAAVDTTALGHKNMTAVEIAAGRADWSLVSRLPSYRLNCRYPRFRSLHLPKSSHLHRLQNRYQSYYLGWMGCS
jgi:hypothetical protein